MINSMKSYLSNTSDNLPDIVRAAYQGDVERVAKLLAEGADPNATDPRDNLSLLHIGCMQGDGELISLLLDHDKEHGNLDFTIRSSYRPRLAWQFAANGHHLSLAELVHEAGLKKGPNPPERVSRSPSAP